MRFRREKAAQLPKQKRPIGRTPKQAGEAVFKQIRVSGKLMNKILENSRPNETYSDTILRMLEQSVS